MAAPRQRSSTLELKDTSNDKEVILDKTMPAAWSLLGLPLMQGALLTVVVVVVAVVVVVVV